MLADDLKFGWRQLIKAPGFTVTAVLTLGLAIGANTAVFSLVDAVLLRPIPYPDPDRLGTTGAIYTRNGTELDRGEVALTGAAWSAVTRDAASVDAACYSSASPPVSLGTPTRTSSVVAQRISAGYFRVLGVPLPLGREFTPAEDVPGGPALAILSHGLWRTMFDGDPSAVGRSVLLKGQPHVVVGVAPPTFRNNSEAEVWTPLRPSADGEGGGSNYGVIVRLRDGVTWARAAAEVGRAIDSAGLRRTTESGMSISHTLLPLQDEMAREVRLPLLMLSTAVGVVLLVACVNLAGLLLARAGRRTREIATRLAIGGDRRVVIRQLFVESLLVAGLGGVLGLAIGAALLEGLKAAPTNLLLTPWGDAALDLRVLSVTLGLTVVTAILFGLVPAMQATRLNVQAALAAGGTRSVAGGSRGRARRAIVATEVALGVVLLISAGLLIRTFLYLHSRPPGFDPANLTTVSASLDDARYESHEQVERLFSESLRRMRELPGVESAAVSLGLPYERILNMGARVIGAGGEQSDFIFTTATYVTPGYFETLRVPVLAGRTLRDIDGTTSTPVAVVNEAFARRYYPGRDAVGGYVRMGGQDRQIVGVVGNIPQRGGFQSFGPIDALPGIYTPFAQFPANGLRVVHGWFSTAWIVRKRAGGGADDARLLQTMAETDPQLAVSSIRGVDDVRAASLERQRLLMTLVAGLGGVALFLAAMGIHALIASGVTERARELGIRMALGAGVGRTIRDAAMPGVVMAVAGLTAGSAMAVAATTLMRSLLWGVETHDPLTFAVVIGLLLTVAVTASVVPAWRVRRLDPVTLFRAD